MNPPLSCIIMITHVHVLTYDNVIMTGLPTNLSSPSHAQSASSLYYALGVNPKVRQSVQAMDVLTGTTIWGHQGWKNLLDCLLALFKAELLYLAPWWRYGYRLRFSCA